MNIDYNNLQKYFDVVIVEGKNYFADVNRVLNKTDDKGVLIEPTDPKEYIIMECPPETLDEKGVFDTKCSWWAKTQNRVIIGQYFRYKYAK